MPRLYRVILPVHDIDRAQRFYSAVFGDPGERVSPGRHYFDCGAILACYDPAADGDELAGGWKHHPNQYVYFAVADLEAVYGRVKASGPVSIDPSIESMPWGERLFYAADPFGNPICFVDETTLFTGS